MKLGEVQDVPSLHWQARVQDSGELGEYVRGKGHNKGSFLAVPTVWVIQCSAGGRHWKNAQHHTLYSTGSVRIRTREAE